MSDQTSVSFDPFTDLRKSSSITQNIKTGGFDSSMLVPLAILAILALLVWKLLK